MVLTTVWLILSSLLYSLQLQTGSFPKPLNAQEEAYYLQRAAQGDLEARNVLIERNLRLVVYIARRFENTGINIEDLISIGTLGLIKAVNTFSPEKGIKLATYASRCIENEILMYIRKNSQSRGDISIDEPLNVDWDGNELLLSDILGSECDIVNRGIEQQDELITLHKLGSKLQPREKMLMEML